MLLYVININNEAATNQRTLLITAFHWQLVFKTGILFSLEMVRLYRNVTEMLL